MPPELPGPADWIKLVATVGATAVIAILLVLVITGIVPTPLMSALQLVPKIYSEQLQAQKPLERLVHFDLIKCLREATTAQARGDCYWEPPVATDPQF